MTRLDQSVKLLVLVLVACTACFAQQTPAADDNVIRIRTELVQTDLTVLDKNGQFVSGLKPEDFELKWDGKPQPILFFERVATGSATEARQLAAVAKSANASKRAQQRHQKKIWPNGPSGPTTGAAVIEGCEPDAGCRRSHGRNRMAHKRSRRTT